MSTEIVWLAPLLLVPGVALLIASTSSRFSDLHEEIHHWLDGTHDVQVVEQAHLVKRARYYRNALVALYLSVFIFLCASVIGAVLDFTGALADVGVFSIVVVGVLAAGFAAAQLIRESLLSLEVIESHVDHIMSEMENE